MVIVRGTLIVYDTLCSEQIVAKFQYNVMLLQADHEPLQENFTTILGKKGQKYTNDRNYEHNLNPL